MSVFLVRHAIAVPRRSWPDDDLSRPLDARGKAQSLGLVEQLASVKVSRVLSSPAVRCVDTVTPFAAAQGLVAEVEDDLFEGHGHRATTLVQGFLAQQSDPSDQTDSDIVLCSHGDVIPEVLAALERLGADLGEKRRWNKGSVWALTAGAKGIVARYQAPPQTS